MIFILDAGALLNSEDFSLAAGNAYFTTDLVLREWRDLRSRALAQHAIERNILTIQDPCPASVSLALGKSAESGVELSDADISIVALASEFAARKKRFFVITDDYSVQNLLKKMRIRFRGVAHGEIKKHRSFRKR